MRKFETFKTEATMLEETYQNAIKKAAANLIGQIDYTSLEEILEAHSATPYYCEKLLTDQMMQHFQPPLENGLHVIKVVGQDKEVAADFQLVEYRFDGVIEEYTGYHIGKTLAAVYSVTFEGSVAEPHLIYLDEEGEKYVIDLEIEGCTTVDEAPIIR